MTKSLLTTGQGLKLKLQFKLPVAFCSCLLFASSCLPVDTGIDFSDAVSELYAAIDYKRNQCGQAPALPLIPPKKSKEYGVRLCSLSILRAECPFLEYPIFCAEMFIDLPGIGP